MPNINDVEGANNIDVFEYSDKRQFLPKYNDKADYNTNALSYYDFLAEYPAKMNEIIVQVNRLLNKDIEFDDSKAIDFTTLGHWLADPTGTYDDLIKITADVKLSVLTETKVFDQVTYQIANAIQLEGDGLYVPDFSEVFDDFGHKLTIVEGDITNLKTRDVTIVTTPTIKVTKAGNWQTSNGLLTFTCDVALSLLTKTLTFDGKSYTLSNAIVANSDGLYAPDYVNVLIDLISKVNANYLEYSNYVTLTNNRLTLLESEMTTVTNIANANKNFVDKTVTAYTNAGSWTGTSGTGSYKAGFAPASGDIDLTMKTDTHGIYTTKTPANPDNLRGVYS